MIDWPTYDVYYSWEPQEDITAYELAVVAPHLDNLAMPWNHHFRRWVTGLPPNIKRHFRELPRK